MVQRERDSVKTIARSAYDLFGRATIKMDQEAHRSFAGRRILGILAPMGNTFPIVLPLQPPGKKDLPSLRRWGCAACHSHRDLCAVSFDSIGCK